MSKPILDVQALGKRFDALQVLQGIDVQIFPGEVVSLIGPNGSGKSTTLNIIGGALKPDAGRVLLDGRDIGGLAPEAIADAGLTRTFQNGRVFGNSSVRENMLVGLTPRLGALRPLAGVRRWFLLRWLALLGETALALWRPKYLQATHAELERKVLKGLGRFGERLLPRLAQPTWQLSYANRRRTEIARALASEPRLLLLDEPTAGMNQAETQEVLEQLLELKAQGQSMLVVEHKLDLVMALSDRVLVLDGGKLIAQGTPQQISEDPAVIEAYLGKRRTSLASHALPGRAATHAVAQPAPLLKVDRLNVFYGRFQALHDVSLEVGAGEIVCLLGGNASGKSTTLKTILHLITPQSGAVLLDEQPTRGWSNQRLVRAGVASVPEARRVFADMSVEENLLMGAYTRQDRRALAQDLAQQYELFPRLAERRLQRAGTLSGGEQQMLAFGRALMSRPRLVCMDEPTMGLSPKLVEQVLEYIQRINRELGIAVLMVEQNAELALSIAHRGYVLQTGVMRLAGTANQLLSNAAVREAYLGKPLSEPSAVAVAAL